MKKLVKIVVTSPSSHSNLVRQAIGDAGGGVIGNYSHCTFTLKGVGRYKPLTGANPFIGKVGEFEEVEEDRIEVTCQKDKVRQIIAAIKKVHPYEEVALDIYPLLTEEDL